MSEEKNIVYSAADIRRYHNKLMSAKEMHALEKAALDDPFLADALEGYGISSTDTADDIALLRDQLNKRVVSETKVIPIAKPAFPLLRVAALVIVIAGAGLLAYQFVFTNKDKEVATTDLTNKKTNLPVTDSNNSSTQQSGNSEYKLPDTQENSAIKSDEVVSKAPTIIREKTPAYDSVSVTSGIVASPVKDAVAEEAEAKNQNELTAKKEDKEPAAQLSKAKAVQNDKLAGKTSDEDYRFRKNNSLLERTDVAKGNKNSQPYFKSNVFRGQVVDATNTPLPFANVTNTKDNVGTYTDVRGNFTLISPDSLLNVQIRSVGFEYMNSQLQNNVSTNAIVLQEDISKTPTTVLSNKQSNTDRSKRSTLTVEEPEPYDGWYNYDTYLANNIELPEERRKQNVSVTEVELSFDISKNGEPINIKVERSACSECDAEAIRLLKEGPKWKKKKRNKRARLNVAF